MKKLTSALLTISLGALSHLPLAHAGSESGAYLGFGIGQSSVEVSELDQSFSADETGYKFILGYNFGVIPLLDLGIEGAYVNFGKADDGQFENELTAWDGFGLVGLSFGPLGLFGKAGFAAWDNETSIGQISTSTSGTDPVYGIGARLQIASVSARLEYEYYDFDSDVDASMTSLSLLYTF
jgi:opacity protein-like surface antigen